MSDRSDPTATGPPAGTPQTPWEAAPAFREYFLLHAPPLAAETLRLLGRHFYDSLLEHGLWEPAEPWVRARVRALVADLLFTGEVLASLAEARAEARLDPEEMALATRCETWAAEVAALAAAIEGALGPVERTS